MHKQRNISDMHTKRKGDDKQCFYYDFGGEFRAVQLSSKKHSLFKPLIFLRLLPTGWTSLFWINVFLHFLSKWCFGFILMFVCFLSAEAGCSARMSHTTKDHSKELNNFYTEAIINVLRWKSWEDPEKRKKKKTNTENKMFSSNFHKLRLWETNCDLSQHDDF